MHKPHLSSAILETLLIAGLILCLSAPGKADPPPGLTVLPSIDLSPGADVSAPGFLAVNRSTHKLYVGGRPGEIVTFKVIDTIKKIVTNGFTFGAYPGANPLAGFDIAVDESSSPEGNKLYVVGKPSSQYVLRVIDGATDTELTGRGTDIVLPVTQASSGIDTFHAVVNPNNHKVYISTQDGHVVVVGNVTVIDGTSHSVETTFSWADSNSNPVVYGVASDDATNIIYLLTSAYDASYNNHYSVRAFDGNNHYQPSGELGVIGQSFRDLRFNSATRQLYAAVDDQIAVYQLSGTPAQNRFANLATRMRVGTGDDALISGLIITGPAGSTKKVMLRAIGPSLGSRGIADAVPDTTLELHDPAGNVVTNDDWKINDSTHASQQAEIKATGIPPTSDLESAIVADLAPGVYTAVLRGKESATGVAVAEVYDLDATSSAQLANISTRGNVAAGDDAMIGGVIVTGTSSSSVLVRALGSSLVKTIPNALQNPTLELRDPNGALIEANDDWKTAHETEITATGIPPTDEQCFYAKLVKITYPPKTGLSCSLSTRHANERI